MFLGGAAGSAAANAIWYNAGWPGVCILGGTQAIAATLLQLTTRR